MNELLDLVLQAAGGIEQWHEVRSLDARASVIGGLFQLKGYPEGVPDVIMRIDPNSRS